MGSRRKKLHSKQIHKKMKLAIIASLFIISGISAFTISEDEAKSAIVSSRVRRNPFGSDNERECAEKQCNLENYLEGRENLDNRSGTNVRKEINASRTRTGTDQNWHKNLFDKYYSDCWARVKSVDLHKTPFKFGKVWFDEIFTVKRDEYYAAQN